MVTPLLNDSLVTSLEEAWRLPPTLYSCWNARGSYHPLQFVLRLRPDVHRALDTPNAEADAASSGTRSERIQAYSTYFHETIHWWQHVGSTLGLMLSFLSPAQAHFNKHRLDEILRTAGPVKSLRKLNAIIAAGGSLDRQVGDALNVVLNNWHDIEFFRHVVCDPKSAAKSLHDPYFDCVGHSFEIALGSTLWLLSATFDPELRVVPDPRLWEPEFRRLREARELGFYFGSDVRLPPLGARAIFEAQARFSQIQLLYAHSDGRLSWDDFAKAGMLRGIYREAFDGFLEIVGAAWPSTPADPLVGLFLLICDLAINPSDGFPCDLVHVESVVQSVDPGMRFLMLCEQAAREGAPFLGAITECSKTEYLEISAKLCKALVCEPPSRIAEIFDSWIKGQPTFAHLLDEDETFKFSEGNLPIRVFFARFLRFQRDKLATPHFFCWPGIWMDDRAGTWSIQDARNLFARHEALFIDGVDGDIYPRLLPDKDAAVIDRTFNTFYGGVAAYELTRQWIVDDGPFEFDFLWLTSKYSRADVEKWASDIFEQTFHVHPGAFRVL